MDNPPSLRQRPQQPPSSSSSPQQADPTSSPGPLGSATTPITTFVEGPANSPVLLFFHGWPDDESVWHLQVAHFSKRFRCVRVRLPNCGGKVDRPWGLGFQEVLDQIKAALGELGVSQVVLVSHDWGCRYGYMLEQQVPGLVRKMVALDVGGSVLGPSERLKGFLILLYQLNLAYAFILGHIPLVGHALGGLWSLMTMMIFVVASVGNAPPKGVRLAQSRSQHPFTPLQNYPYYYVFRDVLCGTASLKQAFRPSCPVLYVYGGAGYKAVLNFQNSAWLQFLEGRKGCRAVEFKDAGHWLMQDKPEELHRLMEEFLGDVQ